MIFFRIIGSFGSSFGTSRDVLDEILDLIESVSEGFPTYSWVCLLRN